MSSLNKRLLEYDYWRVLLLAGKDRLEKYQVRDG